MPKFSYRVQDDKGQTMEGVLDAASEVQAQKHLMDEDYEILQLKEVKEGNAFSKLFQKKKRVNVTQLNFFVRQMATLLKAGVPMMTSLETLRDGAKDEVLRNTIATIHEDVEKGTGFSQSIAKHPEIFNTLFVATIRSGEAIGELDTVLGRLADILEKDYKTQEKVKSALRYPMIAFSVLAVAFTVATIFIIPRFESLFSSFDAQLPMPTLILMGCSNVMRAYWYILLAVLGLIILGVRYHYKTHSGMRFWDSLMLRTYVMGDFMKNVVYSRFSRMLGLMLRSGVNILQGLELISEIVGNSIVSDSILKMKAAVSEGATLSSKMKEEDLFPILLVQMISVGEESGRMDELLIQASDFYDDELDVMTKNLETLIEPVFILILAVFVTIMALGIFLPMWNLYSVMQGG